MAIVKMKRLSLLALQSDKESIFDALIRTRSVELKRSADIKSCVNADNSLAREQIAVKIKSAEEATRYVAEQIDKYNSTHKGQKAQVASNGFARPLTEIGFDDLLGFSHRAAQIETQLDDLQKSKDELAETESEIARTRAEMAQVSAYVKLTHPTSWYADTDSSLVQLSLLPSSEWEKLRALADEYDSVEVELVDASSQTCVVVVVAHKSQADFLQKAAALGLIKSSFVCDVLPSAMLDSLQVKLNGLYCKRDNVLQVIVSFGKNVLDWKVYIDYLGILDKKLSADADLQETASTFVLEAYYPAEAEDKVLAAIGSVTDCVETYLYEIGEDEFAPTLVRNNKIVKQFEFVTNNYTPPDYHEIDPNPVMSVFYFLIFGLMVADIGYGLLFVIAGLAARFFIKQDNSIKTILQLFEICGIAAIGAGALFSSFFSFPMPWNAVIPDPSKYPMVMMIISLLFGLLHITAGVCCNMAVKIKHGQKLAAWLTDFPWVITFLSFILVILNPALDMANYDGYSFRLPEAVSQVSLYVCLSSLAAGVLFAGLGTKGILGKAMKSFGSAYGLINYFSDVMSYIRVFGLMLSSALMGQVINQLAEMVMGNGGIGYVFAALLLILAHVFNLILGIMGVYIHDGRLQYVEFFGKFYTGDGQLFVPFCSDTKYTYIVD